MRLLLQLCLFLYFSFNAVAAAAGPQHVVPRAARYDHEAVDVVDIGKRQMVNVLPFDALAFTTKEEDPSILTYVTPSPSARPIPITTQFQTVTSYVPQITICALPPLAYISSSFANPSATGPPYLNYLSSVPTVTGTCETTYSPTVTPICYSVLAGVATKFTVTDCAQNVTFSKDKGFEIDYLTTSAASGSAHVSPSIRTLYTYYIAPWDELTTPGMPPEDVEKKVCTTYANGTQICIGTIEKWYVETVTMITSRTSTIDITTTVNGPAQVMFETLHMIITETETILLMSTHLALLYAFETLTTIRSNVSATDTVATTHTITEQVAYNTPSSIPAFILPPPYFPSALFPVPEETETP